MPNTDSSRSLNYKETCSQIINLRQQLPLRWPKCVMSDTELYRNSSLTLFANLHSPLNDSASELLPKSVQTSAHIDLQQAGDASPAAARPVVEEEAMASVDWGPDLGLALTLTLTRRRETAAPGGRLHGSASRVRRHSHRRP